jgi:hypothetical protein
MAAPEEECNVEYNEIPVDAKVDVPRVSIDTILSIASEIWGKIKKCGFGPEENTKNEKFLKQLQDEYKDFMSSFPLVLRWMVQFRQFSKGAFRRYLGYYSEQYSKGLRSENDFLDLQAAYVVFLQRKLNPRIEQVVLNDMKEKTLKALQDEAEEFKKIQKEAAAEIERMDKSRDAEIRRVLYEQLIKNRLSQASSSTS